VDDFSDYRYVIRVDYIAMFLQ